MSLKQKFGCLVKSGLFKSAGVYMGASLFNAALPFLLMPFLTRWLDRQDYGRVAMFQVAVNVTSLLVGASVDGSITRVFFERSKSQMATYLGNCILILAASTCVLSLLAAGFSRSIAGLLELPSNVIWFVLVVSATRFVANAALSLWQVRNEPAKYSIFQISQSILGLVLTLVLVRMAGMGWWGIVYSQLCAGLLFAFVGAWYLAKEPGFDWRFCRSDWVAALAFGVPLIPHSLGGLAIGMTDRIAISNMISLEAAGVYVVGVQIGMGINLIQSAFNTAWTPWLFERLKRNWAGDKLQVTRVIYAYSVAILGMAGVLSLCAPTIFQLFVGPKFQEAVRYVPWIATGFALNGMYKMVGGVVLFMKRTGWMAGITVAAGCLNILATILCVARWGVIGAAYAIPLSFGFLFVMTWIASRRCMELPWSFREVFGLRVSLI